MSWDAVLQLDAIPDGGSIGLDPNPRGGAFRVLVVRRGARVWAYRNRCPHRGLPLDFEPGSFLTPDGAFIMCTNHVALFRIEDGICTDGPCKGAGLPTVAVQVHGDQVRIGT